MPLNEEKKAQILDRLRVECDRDELDEYGIPEEYPESFSVMVQKDINAIVAQKLNQNCPDWKGNFERVRHKGRFTYEEIADRMGVHHTSVLETLKKDSVDLFYLEAFSLILQAYPHELLGLEVPHPVSPMCYWSSRNKAFSNIIMSMHSNCNSLKELERLTAIIKLGKLRHNAYKEFIAKHGKVIKFQKAHDINPHESPLSRDTSWMAQTLDRVMKYKAAVEANDEEQQRIQYAFLEAYYVVHDLEKRSPQRLKELAQIALSDNLEKWLIHLMLEKNYPYTHTKLQEYEISFISTPQVVSQQERKDKIRGQKRKLNY